MELPEFADVMLHQSNVKPVHVVIVDGGPDENPRYRKVIDVAIHHFRKHQLDAMFIATNAPGRSAFNRVERRMAPLSRELSGLVLPHDHYGSHLDERLRTTDSELEKEIFKYDGETLADVWNQMTFDGFPVMSEYVDPAASELTSDSILCWDADWFSAHVRSSHYFLQIVKCSNRYCCGEPRSSYFDIMSNQFLPAPIPIRQTDDGLKAPGPSMTDTGSYPSLFVRSTINIGKMLPKSLHAYKELPYDLYCPSAQKVLQSRICKTCGVYFASQVMLTEHNKLHKAESTGKNTRGGRKKAIAKRDKEVLVIENQEAFWIDEGSDIDNDLQDDMMVDDLIPVITIDEHLQPVWQDS